MPIIRAEESVAPIPSPPPVQGVAGVAEESLARGLAQAGEALTGAFNIASRVAFAEQQREIAKRNAFAQAKAVKEANEAEVGLLQDLTRIEQELVASGDEDRYMQDALEAVNFHSNNVEERTATSLMGDVSAAREALEARFQPIRRDIIKRGTTLIADKAKRAITEASDSFLNIVREEPNMIAVDQRLDTLFTDIDAIAVTGGLAPADVIQMKENVILRTLKDRQAFWIEQDPDAALPIMEQETAALRDKLDAINGMSLAEASQQSETAFQEETLRQLKNLILLHGMGLDEALLIAADAGIDPTKITAVYDSRVNREQNEINFRETQDRKRVKEASDALGSELRKNWLQNRSSLLQMQDDLDAHWNDLLPDERNSLISFMESRDKALADVVDDPLIVRALEQEIFSNPTDAATGDAITKARQDGQLSEAKMESLFGDLFAAKAQIRNKAEETRLRQFNTMKSEIGKFLDTTSAMDFDPTARDVKDAAFERMNRAFYNREMVKGDTRAMLENPIGFANQVKREYRAQLDQALAEDGFRIAVQQQYMSLPPSQGAEQARLDARSGAISRLEAEKVLHLYEMLSTNRFKWPENVAIRFKRDKNNVLRSDLVPADESGVQGRSPEGLVPQGGRR